MEQTRRVNAAIELLQKNATPGEVVSALIAQFPISSRQAHRYLQRARRSDQPLSLPESKGVFTVKLPKDLIREIRCTARQRGRRISDVTAEALWAFLQRKNHG